MTPLERLIERYEQTPDAHIAHGAYRIGDTYCVLGMALDIYSEAKGVGEWLPSSVLSGRYRFILDGQEVNECPEEVLAFFGIKEWDVDNLVESNDMRQQDGNATQ